jgi:MoxR-like ATPase
LSDFQVTIPELGTLRALQHPAVVLTSNNTRELSEALKRRCLYLYIDHPSVEQELQIVRLRVPDLNERAARQSVELVHRLRGLDLRKAPGVSETLDWARALVLLNARSLTQEVVRETLSVLLKHEKDLQLARRAIAREEHRPSASGVAPGGVLPPRSPG